MQDPLGNCRMKKIKEQCVLFFITCTLRQNFIFGKYFTAINLILEIPESR